MAARIPRLAMRTYERSKGGFILVSNAMLDASATGDNMIEALALELEAAGFKGEECLLVPRTYLERLERERGRA